MTPASKPSALNAGVVDIRVRTRDVWTLMPGFSLSRRGGENRTRFSLSERNLLGTGITVRLEHTEDVDRDSTAFEYFDKQIGDSWASLFVELADNSDGHRNDIRLIRPFYALDARWSAGATAFDDSRAVSFYELGNEVAEYQVDTRRETLSFGWSGGLVDGWVRRLTASVTRDQREYAPVANGVLPSLIPADIDLVYPSIGFEILEDRFETTANRDQMERTEDFYLGTRLWGSVGFASGSLGSDRRAWLFGFGANKGFGRIDRKALLLSATAGGRVESGSVVNGHYTLNARFYNQINEKRLFFMTLDARHAERPDLDQFVLLGGDSGLRGYPLRYQSGRTRLLLTAEQRVFTDWYPFKLARVGGAAFVDVGRTWGASPLGNEPLGWLKNVGIGLRLAPTRSSGREVIHLDLAFPLDGDPTIDDVQILLESKRSF